MIFTAKARLFKDFFFIKSGVNEQRRRVKPELGRGSRAAFFTEHIFMRRSLWTMSKSKNTHKIQTL